MAPASCAAAIIVFGRVDRTQHVRHVGESDEFGLLLQQLCVDIQVERTFIGHGDKLKTRAGALGEQLPGYEVAVMLHLGQYDQIAGGDVGRAPAVGHQIDALRRVAREDDLLALACIDETGGFHPRFLHCRRRFLADLVDAAMDIGMDGLVIVAHGVDDSTRFLRTCRTVKVNERFPVYLARQDRKVIAYFRCNKLRPYDQPVASSALISVSSKGVQPVPAPRVPARYL